MQRPQVNTAHELAELIIDQCVGVLQKPDMTPDLDFLKKYVHNTISECCPFSSELRDQELSWGAKKYLFG